MAWKIVKCTCGHHQLTRAINSFKCFKCGHTTKITDKNIIFTSQNPSEAREQLLKIKTKTT